MHSVWTCERGPWYGNIIHSLYFWFELPRKKKRFEKRFASALGSVSSTVWLALHTNTGFPGSAFIPHTKPTVKLPRRHLLQSIAAQPSLMNGSSRISPSTKEGNFSLCPMSFTSPALSYKYSSAWAQMNNVHTTNNQSRGALYLKVKNRLFWNTKWGFFLFFCLAAFKSERSLLWKNWNDRVVVLFLNLETQVQISIQLRF